MHISLNPTWQIALEKEFTKPYFTALSHFVDQAYSTKTIYPAKENLFKAFDLCPLDQVKVVLLGQDPYHGAGQAQGLCFSVPEGIAHPPSLRNILKELASDVGVDKTNGDLTPWAMQGVFLLNASLTVEASKAGSHQKKGWEQFTDAVIQTVSDTSENVVFILWGSYAHKKTKLIDASKHHIIQSVHPSPLSSYRGFFGSKPFSKTNAYLSQKGINPIVW